MDCNVVIILVLKVCHKISRNEQEYSDCGKYQALLQRRIFHLQNGNKCSIVEVHPGATLALHGAPVEEILTFKKDQGACTKLLDWLEDQGMKGIKGAAEPTDHYVACCASALAVWKWHSKMSKWVYPARLPFDPFDFAC